MRKDVSVVTKSDDNFFPGLIACLNSLRATNPELPVQVLDCGLSRENLKALESFDVSIQRANVDKYKISRSEDIGKFTGAIYGLLNYEFDATPITIALDADTLVLDSLWNLSELASKHGIAAVSDFPALDIAAQVKSMDGKMAVENLFPKIAWTKVAFNAGVMAVTSDQMKKMRPHIQRLSKYHELFWGNDQAIMNIAACFVNNEEPFFDAGSKYNSRPNYSRAPTRPPLNFNFEGRRPKITNLGEEVAILHFVGRSKPWHDDFDQKSNSYRTWKFYRDLR